MKLTYVIVPEEQLLIARIIGSVTLNDIKVLIPELWADPSYNRDLKTLVDLRDTEMQFSTSDMGQLSDFLINSGKSAVGKMGLVVSTPMETALSYLFEKQMVHTREVGVYSTFEEAYNFLGCPSSLHEFLQSDGVKTLGSRSANRTT